MLAHLIMVERNAQHYVNELVQHPGAAETVVYPASVPERLAACLALFPSVTDLLARLEEEQQATLVFCDALQPRLYQDPRPAAVGHRFASAPLALIGRRMLTSVPTPSVLRTPIFPR